ncbi:MAG: signal peptide peptidase SppA [Candidatus Krumholzibacteriia bacterium]
MRKFWIVFVIIAVVIGGGLGLLWKAATQLDRPGQAGGGVLHWRASGALPEAVDDSFLGQLQAGDQLTFRQAVFGLRRAAEDPHIKALVLELDGLAVSWAQLGELSRAVHEVRDAGKPVWAVVSFAGNADYALATAADHVVMAPEGNLMILGVAAELAFLKDTLAKVGIEAEFLHVGEYKSAPEQLTRTEASDANRAMTRSLVDERYEQLVDLIATGRGRDTAEVVRWIDTGMYDGETALASGLVDTLADAEGLLKDLLPDEDVADFVDYARAGTGGRASHEVALIVAEGAIYPGESRQDPLQGAIMGSDTVIDQLARAAEDDKVEAVLLRVNSPGGSAMASDLIWREVERVRQDKPVVVSMGGYAASGGYYISCGADSIFAERGTLTGSIGVFAGKMNWSGLYAKLDLHREMFTRGENALFWHDGSGFTPAQRELFQDQLDRFYARFVAKVADGRELAFEEVDRVARGRVWTGRQALAEGLVDGLGGLDRALLSVKHLIGAAPDDKVRVRTYGKEMSWLERTMLDALRSSGASAAWRAPDPLAQLPASVRALVPSLRSAGLADVAPLLDGRPVALMTWRPVASPGSPTP